MNHRARVDDLVARMIAGGVEIRATENAPWIADVESRLGTALPADFRDFVIRYSFPLLEFKDVELFSNLGDMSEYDLTHAPFRDPNMSPWLIGHGLVHIGFPYIGNYDPICLELSSASTDEGPGIVRLNHEDILLERATVHRTSVSPSFLALLEKQIDV